MPDGMLIGACTAMMCPREPENLCTANGVLYEEGNSGYTGGLMQDCSISSVLTMGLLPDT